MRKERIDELTTEFMRKCRKSGYRITPQRMAIYRELLKDEGHPSIDEILAAVRNFLPNVSFDTVYRNLISFFEAGLIDSVEVYGGPRRFEPILDPHHHFRCTVCGRLVDFHSFYYDSLSVPDEIKREFNVEKIRITLEGVCKSCK